MSVLLVAEHRCPGALHPAPPLEVGRRVSTLRISSSGPHFSGPRGFTPASPSSSWRTAPPRAPRESTLPAWARGVAWRAGPHGRTVFLTCCTPAPFPWGRCRAAAHLILLPAGAQVRAKISSLEAVGAGGLRPTQGSSPLSPPLLQPALPNSDSAASSPAGARPSRGKRGLLPENAIEEIGHHRMFSKSVSHVAGTYEKYRWTWVFNLWGEKIRKVSVCRGKGGRKHQCCHITHCSPFRALGTPVGTPERRMKYTRCDSEPGSLQLPAVNILGWITLCGGPILCAVGFKAAPTRGLHPLEAGPPPTAPY